MKVSEASWTNSTSDQYFTQALHSPQHHSLSQVSVVHTHETFQSVLVQQSVDFQRQPRLSHSSQEPSSEVLLTVSNQPVEVSQSLLQLVEEPEEGNDDLLT